MTLEQMLTDVLLANRELPAHQLVVSTWGNVSAIDRQTGLVAIKPSGVPYDQLEARHIVVLDLAGKVVSGTYRPSSDTATHLELYRCFSQIGGIVHTHSRWATAWAQASRNLPALGTTHADYFYGDIPCTRSLTPEETEEDYEGNTGKVIVELFRQHQLDPAAMPGVLVANHGPFTWGGDAREAVHHAVVLEECAQMALHALMLNPDAARIDQHILDKHYYRKHGGNAYYGQKP